MSHWTTPFEASVLALATLWLLLGLLRSPEPVAGNQTGSQSRSALEIVWLVFCASIAMLMLRRLGGAGLGGWQYLIGLGACFTCNAFWLVARGLFHPGRPFAWPQLLFALSIAGLLMIHQLLQLAAVAGAWSPESAQLLGAALGEIIELLGSTVLVLAFWEGLRGWAGAVPVERRLRLLYLCTYGGCVLFTSSLPRLFGTQAAVAEALFAAVSALAILIVTQGLVWWRLRHPLTEPTQSADRAAAGSGSIDPVSAVEPVFTEPAPVQAVQRADEQQLAARLDTLVRERRLFLQAELKLVHLAQALEVSEYRISRAITGGLGERNVNRYLNGLRINHARQLLRDPRHADWSVLTIALESGFASLGPFNRAFKEATGHTPGEYRNARCPEVASA